MYLDKLQIALIGLGGTLLGVLLTSIFQRHNTKKLSSLENTRKHRELIIKNMELILARIEHNSSIKKGEEAIDSHFEKTRELMAEVQMASKIYFPTIIEFVEVMKKENDKLQRMSQAFRILELEKGEEKFDIPLFDDRHPLSKIISSEDICKDMHQKIIKTLCSNET